MHDLCKRKHTLQRARCNFEGRHVLQEALKVSQLKAEQGPSLQREILPRESGKNQDMTTLSQQAMEPPRGTGLLGPDPVPGQLCLLDVDSRQG